MTASARPVSRAERRISYALLALLPVIAMLVYLKGQRYDPAVFAPDPSLLAEPGSAPAPLPRADGLLADITDPEWHADGDVERFTADTLYQKIDGRADAYLTRGFRALAFVSFTNGRDFIDVFAYDMTTPGQAAAMLVSERPPQAAAGDLGPDSYRADASRFFTEGRYYVQVVASDRGRALEVTGLELGRAVAGRLRATIAGGPQEPR